MIFRGTNPQKGHLDLSFFLISLESVMYGVCVCALVHTELGNTVLLLFDNLDFTSYDHLIFGNFFNFFFNFGKANISQSYSVKLMFLICD